MRESTDVLEADLQRYYGVDLADLWRGGLSVRRLSVLVDNLPDDSATARRQTKGQNAWDLHALLLADVFHALTGEPHPSRPQPKRSARYSETRKALEEQRARSARPTT